MSSLIAVAQCNVRAPVSFKRHKQPAQGARDVLATNRLVWHWSSLLSIAATFPKLLDGHGVRPALSSVIPAMWSHLHHAGAWTLTLMKGGAAAA
jgi:hypothetical protein